MVRSFCKDRLTRVVGCVVGAVHHDGKSVARKIFSEILIGNCRMLLQPALKREPLKGNSELVIDFGPRFPKFGCRERVIKRSVGVSDVSVIQLGVESLAEIEQRKHAIMNGSQMAEEIEQAVL